MKMLFASLGIGLLIPASLVLFMLTIKILFPGTTSGMFLLWFFLWPLPVFVRLFPGLPDLSVGLLSFLVGAFLDIVILSITIYAALSAIKRRQPQQHS